MFKKVQAFYPVYLQSHQNKINRLLHFVGNLLTLIFIFFLLISGKVLFLMFAPFIIYFFAWPGHLFFEKNKPATWHTSWWITKGCDWIMMKDMIFNRKVFQNGKKQ